MTLVFVSNYLNHHQAALCDALCEAGEELVFVETDAAYVQGFQAKLSRPYVLDYAVDRAAAEDAILRADAVVFGACPDRLIALRMAQNKLSFLYTERFFKKGAWRRWIPRTAKHLESRVGQYRDKPLYVLCAGAYVAHDVSLLRFPIEKCYRWGYFPPTSSPNDLPALFARKQPRSLLWVGRMLDWKHPEEALACALRLKKAGCSFSLDFIGTGPLEQRLARQIAANGLGDCVRLLGPKTAEETRACMEEAAIVLCTSDRREGWGAVINEAMGAGCAVIASRYMGAAPCLIEDGRNGYLYRQGDLNGLLSRVKALLASPETTAAVGQAAYATVQNEWHYTVAAKRLVCLCAALANHTDPPAYTSGPLSPAPLIADARRTV